MRPSDVPLRDPVSLRNRHEKHTLSRYVQVTALLAAVEIKRYESANLVSFNNLELSRKIETHRAKWMPTNPEPRDSFRQL